MKYMMSNKDDVATAFPNARAIARLARTLELLVTEWDSSTYAREHALNLIDDLSLILEDPDGYEALETRFDDPRSICDELVEHSEDLFSVMDFDAGDSQ